MLRARSDGGGKVRRSGRGSGQSGGAGASYGTWDPLNKDSKVTLSGSNLVATFPAAAGGTGSVKGQTEYTSGDRYFEVRVTAAVAEFIIGVGTSATSNANPPGTTATSWGYYQIGRGYTNGAFTWTGTSFAVGDYIGVRFDGTTITWYKNGVQQGQSTPGRTDLKPMAGNALGNTPQVVATINTGGSAFQNQPANTVAWS